MLIFTPLALYSAVAFLLIFQSSIGTYMSLNAVQAGSKLPDQVNVIIEIPAHADPVK